MKLNFFQAHYKTTGMNQPDLQYSCLYSSESHCAYWVILPSYLSTSDPDHFKGGELNSCLVWFHYTQKFLVK